MCCSEASWEVWPPIVLGLWWTLPIEAVSAVKLFLQVVLSTAAGNGNEVKWSEKLESHFSALGVIYQFIVEETIR